MHAGIDLCYRALGKKGFQTRAEGWRGIASRSVHSLRVVVITSSSRFISHEPLALVSVLQKEMLINSFAYRCVYT